MADPHTEMHEFYAGINAAWAMLPQPSLVLTDDDSGKIAELFRRCRDRLGGCDQDLVGQARWELASREGWSTSTTYSCLPRPKNTWPQFVHDVAHWCYPMLPSDDPPRYGDHDVGHASLELELTKIVVEWLAVEAGGVKLSFEPLNLSRPPDLRRR